MTPFDLKRLESYSNNMLDYHVVLDVLPTVASLYFQKRLVGRSTDESTEAPGTSSEEKEAVHLSAVQSSILLGLGLQRKTVEDLEGELDVPVSQLLALFTKIVRKISKRLVGIQKEAIGRELPPAATNTTETRMIEKDWKPVGQQMDEELDEAGKEVTSALKERQREMIDSLDLSKYVLLSRCRVPFLLPISDSPSTTTALIGLQQNLRSLEENQAWLALNQLHQRQARGRRMKCQKSQMTRKRLGEAKVVVVVERSDCTRLSNNIVLLRQGFNSY